MYLYSYRATLSQLCGYVATYMTQLSIVIAVHIADYNNYLRYKLVIVASQLYSYASKCKYVAAYQQLVITIFRATGYFKVDFYNILQLIMISSINRNVCTHHARTHICTCTHTHTQYTHNMHDTDKTYMTHIHTYVHTHNAHTKQLLIHIQWSDVIKQLQLTNTINCCQEHKKSLWLSSLIVQAYYLCIVLNLFCSYYCMLAFFLQLYVAKWQLYASFM